MHDLLVARDQCRALTLVQTIQNGNKMIGDVWAAVVASCVAKSIYGDEISLILKCSLEPSKIQ